MGKSSDIFLNKESVAGNIGAGDNNDQVGMPIKESLNNENCDLRSMTREVVYEREKKFRQLAELTGLWIWEVDPDGLFTYSNKKSEVLIGFSPAEIIGKKHFYDFFAPMVKEELKMAAFAFFKRKEPIRNFEHLNINKSGKTVLFETTCEPMFDEKGNLLGYMGAGTNITQRKISELEILKLHQGIEQCPLAVAITDISGRIQYVNKKFIKALGYESEEIKGRQLRILKRGHTTDDEFENIWKTLRSGNEWKGEYLNRTKSREKCWESVLISPVKDMNGKVTNFIMISEDISHRKQMEADLVATKEKAEESDRLKTAFLRNISHEIRTPMNAIVGFCSLLKEADLQKEDVNSYIDLICQSCDNLLTIITDIVDVAAAEARKGQAINKEFNVNVMLRFLYEQFRLKLDDNIRLHCELSLPDEEVNVLSDEAKITQIITNLMDNAFKFTHEGLIEFGYFKKSDNLEFFVKDSGIGIREEYQEKIFEQFFQVETSLSGKSSGTGLGLSLSKAYADILGGDIRVESSLNEGSIFYFKLPFRGCPNSKKEALKMGNEKKSIAESLKTILVAEDEDTNFMLFTLLVRDLNLNIKRACNGKEAVEIVRDNPDIDLIFLDIKMPVMDGYEASGLIKEIRSDVPVIALTAYAYESERTKAIDCGCSDCLSKPYQKADLIEKLEKYLN
ncbi:MAG TPA: PAS domain S-box protein [Bacteroidales bacterium]|nr:PAS domain S-box protein [Bacteroidales bacterium]